MENEKLIAKTKKQLSKLGYSEEKINEFLADLEKEDEEEKVEEPKEEIKNEKVEEPKVQTPLEQEKLVDVRESETTDNEEIKEEPKIDYESKYNDLKAYVDNALKGINEKFEGLSAKTDKSYEMLSALGSDEKPQDAEEEHDDKIAKMFGGYVSESFPSKEEIKEDSSKSLFETKKER